MNPTRRSISTDSPGFSGQPAPALLNLARYCLGQSPLRADDKTALIICNDPQNITAHQRWTCGQLREAVLRLSAGLLSRGLKTGQRVFIRMGNSIDYALVFFAANAAGLVPVAASSQLSANEVKMMVDDCGAACLIHDGSLPLPALRDDTDVIGPQELVDLKSHAPGSFADTRCNDPGFMVYTSGTTSRPKGVLHAQRAVWGRRPMYRDWYEISSTDRLLHTGAFNWTYTLGTGLFDPWANGATAIVYTGAKDMTVWPRIAAAYKPTIMASVPGLYRQILKYNHLSNNEFNSLRHCLCAGEALQVALHDAWRAKTGLQLCEAFGMSEISTYISTPPRGPFKPGSPGKPQAGRCVAILPMDTGSTPVKRGHSGMIAVHRSDPAMMREYWQRPSEQEQQFRGDWFVTGDTGKMDDDGYIWFEGRNDDIINAMGYRVSPMEVEAVLSKFPAISEICVHAIKVRDDVEIIIAFIVPENGSEPDISAIQNYAAQNLASYKCPKKYVTLQAMPRNAAGKVVRAQLKVD